MYVMYFCSHLTTELFSRASGDNCVGLPSAEPPFRIKAAILQILWARQLSPVSENALLSAKTKMTKYKIIETFG